MTSLGYHVAISGAESFVLPYLVFYLRPLRRRLLSDFKSAISFPLLGCVRLYIVMRIREYVPAPPCESYPIARNLCSGISNQPFEDKKIMMYIIGIL